MADSPIDLRARDGGLDIPLLVVPGASRERILGPHGGRLRLSVTAPPEAGAANRSVTGLLAKVLGVRRRDVQITSGHGSRRKGAHIEGITADEARERLSVAGFE